MNLKNLGREKLEKSYIDFLNYNNLKEVTIYLFTSLSNGGREKKEREKRGEGSWEGERREEIKLIQLKDN